MRHPIYTTDYSHLQGETRPTRILRALGVSYLGACDSSAKIAKGAKVGARTYIVYLAPAMLSGFEVCPFRTPECTGLCLHRSGHNSMHTGPGLSPIDVSRIKKTRLMMQAPQAFARVLWHEIAREKAKAERDGVAFAVRINGTSDINPASIQLKGANVLRAFPGVQFYDYTKDPSRVITATDYANYSVTLSYSGRNLETCLHALSQGVNVATVFHPHLPTTWQGYPVIDGDTHDLRYRDPAGVVVGLRLKRTRTRTNIDTNAFVINV